ncbi:Phosphate regulon transcriptional regulatory [Magnetospirillum sp. LM-5]|uniref:response regulator n=1 Tax=Magnetospirillum sp. LM-5 TaxID=2681466 RepID=UPI00137C73B4|nr:response regulator [Magnetospirillum sp. LM-5]CAA7615642.1 Phosphate regulon transcriptional regulatory [Magnetospirillum sp. LM-5]
MAVVEERSRRVLVIDSSQHIRRLFVTLLAAVEVKDVAEARTPNQAVARLMGNDIDLIILDLPRDSTEALLFVHRLRKGEFGNARLPVLALSATTHHAVLETAWEAGIDDVIAKPLSAIDIIHRAGWLLEKREDNTAIAKAAE